jgi:raffinose/stachyose/melibiose transport system permease protein
MSPFGTSGVKRWIPFFWIVPPVLMFLAFSLYPSVFTGYFSLTSYSGLPGTPATFIGLENYRQAFSLGGWIALAPDIEYTLIFAVAVTIVQNVAGMLLALALNKKVRGVSAYRLMIFFPQVLSIVVIGMIWTLIFSPIGGPMEPVWHLLFGHDSAFLGSYALARWLVIFVQAWNFTGFTMLIYLSGLQAVPVELEEAATVDGAGTWKKFWRITWPLLASSATVNIFLSVIGALGDYGMIYVLTDGGFGTTTLGMAMFNDSFNGGSQFGYGAMLQMLQFGLTVLLGTVLLWYMRRREVQL